MLQKGGVIDVKSILGYKDNSPYKNAKSLVINSPNGTITMNGVSKDLIGTDEYGNTQYMKANSGDYQFQGKRITEVPVKQQGGVIEEENSAEGRNINMDYILHSNRNKNFVNRILNHKQGNHILDENNVPMTHRMSYAGTEKGYVVYPEIQEINGKLVNLSRQNNDDWRALDSALDRDDYILFDNENDAKYFTENYKKGTLDKHFKKQQGGQVGSMVGMGLGLASSFLGVPPQLGMGIGSQLGGMVGNMISPVQQQPKPFLNEASMLNNQGLAKYGKKLINYKLFK